MLKFPVLLKKIKHSISRVYEILLKDNNVIAKKHLNQLMKTSQRHVRQILRAVSTSKKSFHEIMRTLVFSTSRSSFHVSYKLVTFLNVTEYDEHICRNCTMKRHAFIGLKNINNE